VSVDIEKGPGPELVTSSTLNNFAVRCCGRLHTSLLTDPRSLSLHQHLGHIGPLTIGEVMADTEVALDFGESCGAYRFSLVRSGRALVTHRQSTIVCGPGDAGICGPQDHLAVRWPANSRIIAGKIAHGIVDDALTAAIGRPVDAQIDFAPAISTMSAAGASWIKMLCLLSEQLLRPDSVFSRPLVGLPFVDSLVRVLLLAGDHRYRDAVAGDSKPGMPRSIAKAVDIIEAEAQLPLTVSSLATRSHISVRALQEGFRRHLGMSPMMYLRQARLHRAHQMLQKCDPTITTVTSIAYQWGFTNVSRFAAAHSARYGESPATTLRRTSRPVPQR
jgi:AraC-like DNA-binding protein